MRRLALKLRQTVAAIICAVMVAIGVGDSDVQAACPSAPPYLVKVRVPRHRDHSDRRIAIAEITT